MRGLYLLLFLALVVNVAALGQSAGDYRSVATGPWNQASTWQVYNGTTWVAAASTPSYTDGVITISDGTTVNIPTGVSITADQVEYENNFGGTTGILVVDATATLTINNGTGDDVRLLNDFTTVASLSVSGTLVLSAGATIVDDDYGNLGIGPGPVSTDTYHILSGGLHNHQIAAVQVSQVPNADWRAGSTCQVTPLGGAPTGTFLASSLNVLIDNTTQFYNFTWSGSGQTATINLAGNLRTVKENLLIDGTGGSILQLGTTQSYTLAVTQNFTIQNNTRIQFMSTGTVVHNIGGNLSLASSSGATNAVQANAAGTLTVNLTGNFSKSGTATFNLGVSTGTTNLNLRGDFSLTGGTMTKSGAGAMTVNFLGSGTANFTNTATMAGGVAYVVQNGKTLAFGQTSTLGGTGNFTLQTGATLQVSSPDGLTISSTGLGNITTSGTRTYQAGANIVYNGSVAQNLGNEWANALNGVAVNLEINNSSTGSNSGVINNNDNSTTSVVGNLKLTKGTFRIGGAKTLSIRKDFTATNGTIAGSATSKLYFIASGSITGTLNMEPGADSLSVLWNFRTNDLTLGTNLTVTDSLRFQNGGCLLINGHTLESDGIAVVEAGTGGIRSALTTSNVTFGGSGAINASNTAPFATKQAGATVTNEFNNITLERTGATYAFAGSNNINGTLDLSVGTITTEVGMFMKTGSTFARSAGTTFGGSTPNATSTYSVSYSGNIGTPTNELPTALSGKLMNLAIAGNVNLDRDLLIKGDLSIASGLFSAGSHNIELAGSNLIANGGSFTITSSNTFTFSKAGTTTLSGSTINGSTFGNFTINTGTTVVAPTANINIAGQWDNNGTFTANGGTITFNGGSQNIDGAGQPFFNFATSGGTKTLASNLDVNGTLTINSGSTLAAGLFNINVAGTWSNAGTYSYDATGPNPPATVIFDGTAQSINSAGQNFNNVTFANSGTKTLAAAIAIKGNMVINSGVTLDVSTSNFNLNVSKNFTNNGTLNPRSGTVFFDGSTFQTIGGTTNTAFYNITTSNASTVTFSSDQSISNVLTLNSGIFSPNNHFTILSTSTRDARIAPLGATASIDATNMTIQRYLPGFAATNNYRYFASSISNGTVAGWQDDFPVTGSFTGSSTVAQWPQFPTMTQNASMWRYNEAQAGNPSVDSRYATYPTTSNGDPTTKGVGYVAWIRQTAEITMEQVGAANYGPIGVTITNQSGQSNDGWNLIGNPYASPINWENVTLPGGLSGQIALKDNVNNIGLGAGAFVYYTQGNPSLAVPASYDGTLASGQAFFVRKTTSGSTTLTFQEDDKNAVQHPQFIREGIVDLLRINVTDSEHADELVIHFEDNGHDIADGYLDAFKMPNDFISFSSVASDGIELAINTMGSISCAKQIPLHLNNVKEGTHVFTFSQFESFSDNIRLRLLDNFTGTSFDVTKDNPIYNFDVTSDSTSFGNGRFTMFIGYQDFDLSLKVETANVCAGTDANVTIYSPQAGITYYATLNGTTVSNEAVGVTGQNLVLSVPKSALNANNNIVLMAKAGQCTGVPLNNHVTIDVDNIPAISAVTNATNCGPGSLMLAASGAPADGSYHWYPTEDAIDAIAGANASSYTTPSLTKTKTYFVSAVNSLGCEGARTAVTATIVYTDSPTITAEGNVLKSSSATGNQWYLDGEAIDGATGQTYEASKTGVYKLVVTVGSCSNEIEQQFTVTGDIEETRKGYMVYPNATTGLINIEVGTTDPVSISVRNPLGIEITRGELRQEGLERKAQFDITGHAAGVYLILIHHGENTVVRKIVKN